MSTCDSMSATGYLLDVVLRAWGIAADGHRAEHGLPHK
jgi:hypothetical protein